MPSSEAPELPPEDQHDESLPSIAPDFFEQDFAGEIDNIIPTRGYLTLPMVGLGGSAGSVQALQAFLAAMPPDSGLVFVVILHLAPDLDSTLATVLGKFTSMPVSQAVDGQKVFVNHVYVIPPGKFLLTVDGHLRLRTIAPERGKRAAVDLFFRSLADTHGPHATAVVLSGADSDGAIGIKRIKERGGLTIAQDPDEAEHSGMPSSAVATGMVDWVLKVAEIPARLVEYHANGLRLNLPPEEESPSAPTKASGVDENESALRNVLIFLRTKTGRNFSGYKRATVVRRLSRRMQVNGIGSLRDYLGFLRTHPGEIGALIQDLLISVTNFFRDREAFAALEERIPQIFEDRAEKDVLRVWVPACATGEEAYSIAMLLIEHAATISSPPAIQVFASDLDGGVIQTARAGIYPAAITADVSEERRRRFFVRETRGYRVRREVREMVLFASHDLLQDAPFSRMDLISCRNLLIYLKPDAQDRLLETFAFSLRPKGLLFLGTSESVDEHHGAFRAVDKKHRLFIHRNHPRKSFSFPHGLRSGFPAGQDQPMIHHQKVRPAIPHTSPTGHRSAAELHLTLLEQAGFPSIVLNAEYDILHLSAGAGRFLEQGAGEPSTNILSWIHPKLRSDLRAALLQAGENRTRTEISGLQLELAGENYEVGIRIFPGQDHTSDFWLVIFEARPLSAGESSGSNARTPEIEPVVRHLERELDRMKFDLRETVEQYEAGTEELKASNEELQAMNEELRLATEELETSREELQSINEELSTVNQEMKSKMEELARTNSDLNNLMAATAIATIFLDRALCITLYTPPAVGLFNLIPGDIGRPLTNLKHHLDYPELSSDVERVISSLTSQEREVRTTEDQWLLARMLPYRTTEDFIAGVVLTFVDITRRKRAEAALADSQEHLRLVIESARDYAIFSMDLERRVTSWNTGAERILGFSESEIMGQPADIIFTPEDRAAAVPEKEQQTATAEGRASDERWHMRKDGTRFWGSGSMMAMHNAKGALFGLVKIFRDHTEARNAREALLAAAEENDRARRAAETATAAKDDFLAALSHELRTPLNPALMTTASLETDPSIPDTARALLTTVRRNIELEARLIDDLLDVTKITRGKMTIHPVTCDIHDLLERAAEIVLSDSGTDKARLEFQQEAGDHWVAGEPSRLQQILWNLLKNAFKFTPANGNVIVRTSNPTPGLIAVTVTDTGIGIAPECLQRIFELFDQGHLDGRHRFGGLGLGLAISRALAELHGGELRVRSDGLGAGSTFILELRTTPPPETTQEVPTAEAEAASVPLRLLLVEDHEPTLTAMVWLLQRDGHKVFTATTAMGALAVAEKEACDVLISDIGLPDGTGHGLMREIKRLHGWPGIALSGYGMPADLAESYAAGFAAHLVKPIKIAALRQTLGSLKLAGASALTA